MASSPGRILVLAPHTDDAELGCGGTLARWAGSVKRVVAFSACESELLPKEFVASCEILGVQSTELWTYRRRMFADARQAILDDLIHLRDEFRPDLVLAPSVQDAHQDHLVIAEEAFRAFRACSLWAYELPWNHETFSTRAFVRLGPVDLEAKCEALSQYKTQAHRAYFQEDFVRGLARVRGVQIGAEYAEAFDVVREVR
jgi:LmbE family N-acetylglucosaminyl deacetylase